MERKNGVGRKKRRSIYKPDYAGVYQIAVAKRAVGVVLAVLVVGVIVLASVWLLPAVWNSMQPSPVEQEEYERELAEDAEARGTSLVYDSATGLPLFENDVNLFAINADHPADSDFEPELETVSGIKVDRRIAPALKMMVEDAWEQGVEVGLVSGYVSYEKQKKLYETEVAALQKQGHKKIMSYEYAKDTVTPPGECDLQSGMCVTLQGDEETFGTTEIGNWLENNMAAYGFVFRYPEGKEKYTGEAGTKLVLRYVGPENAAVMRRLSMSLEEYIDYLGGTA